MQRNKAACSRSHTWQCLQAQSNCTLRLVMWTAQCIPSLEQSHYSNTTTYTLANTAHPKKGPHLEGVFGLLGSQAPL